MVGAAAVRPAVAFDELRVVGGAADTDVDGAGFSIGMTAPVVAEVEPASGGETDTVSRASERAIDDGVPTLGPVRTAVAWPGGVVQITDNPTRAATAAENAADRRTNDEVPQGTTIMVSQKDHNHNDPIRPFVRSHCFATGNSAGSAGYQEFARHEAALKLE